MFSEKDEHNTLKFYFIDLLDSVIRSAQDPTLEGKLYHTFHSTHFTVSNEAWPCKGGSSWTRPKFGHPKQRQR
jgi:hypothetical protein